MFKRENFFVFIILFIISLLLCLDLFATAGKPSSFDGLIHMSNIAQYYTALRDGDFPVRWLNHMANYGMPIPLFSQQTVAYLGAGLMFFFHNTLLSYNIVILLFAFASCAALYWFLREYVNKWSALVGTFIFCFAPYRIINVYIRGAAPEFVASLFLPLILLSLKRWIQNKQFHYFYIFIICLTLLILTHPISMIAFSFIIGAYYLYVIWNEQNKGKILLLTCLAGAMALGIASFYLLPLLMEFKYLYYGQGGSVFLPESYLPASNLLHPMWAYFYKGDILTRGHYLHIGELETMLLIGGLFFLVYQVVYKKKILVLESIFYLVFLVYMVLITQIGTPIFEIVKPLGNIQHQWRLLSGILFIPPFLVALFLHKLNEKNQLLFGAFIICAVVVLRFPQLYGKNYQLTNEASFYSSKDNLYAQVMNTIWTGPTQNYPVKNIKGDVIEGKGQISVRNEHNSYREYTVNALTEIRMADYTFYFPGWKVYVDKKEIPIEFQDMNYRGVITYKVPSGKHTILVIFKNTKIRLLSNILSVVSLICFGVFFMKKKRIKEFISG